MNASTPSAASMSTAASAGGEVALPLPTLFAGKPVQRVQTAEADAEAEEAEAEAEAEAAEAEAEAARSVARSLARRLTRGT